MTQAIGVERLGLTKEEAARFLAARRPLAARMPAVCTLHPSLAGLDFGHHLLDWEAELLRQVFDHFKNVNRDVCVLLTQLIRESETADGENYKFMRLSYVEKRTKREREEAQSETPSV